MEIENRHFSFKLEATTIEMISKQIAKVYKNVHFATFPMLRWVQIINDTTILGEEVRRNRYSKAVERAGRILMRLLDFIGHYLYIHTPDINNPKFPDLVAHAFRESSYSNYFGYAGPEEGPTRWILAKYPFVCAKCGDKPCMCSVEPWVFEDRREEPGPFKRYGDKTEKRRKNLKKNKHIKPFTLPSLFTFFDALYRNSYYNQDPWKLSMHLAEELGEATIELSRLELGWLGQKASFNLKDVLQEVQEQAGIKLEEETNRIKSNDHRSRIKTEAQNKLRTMVGKLNGQSPQDTFLWLASERLKEEIADVFSWLSAVIHRLTILSESQVLDELKKMTDRYIKSKGHRKVLKCPWCGEEACTNNCLISHGITEELIERALKF